MKKTGTLSEQAYQIIKEDITHGVFHPGDILVETKLSERIAISRTPVRAALQRLVFDGLAQTDANKSVRVSDVTEDDVKQVTSVREVLETLAVRLLQDTATPEGIARLRQMCNQEKQLKARETMDHLKLLEIDYDFHVAIAELTGNDFLVDTIKRIKASSNRFLILSGTMDKYGVISIDEHDEIVSFLEKGQFDYAELAMKNHLVKIKNRTMEA